LPIWMQWVSFVLSLVGSASGIYALILNHQRTTITKRKEKERLEAKKKAKFSVDRTQEMGSKRIQNIFSLQNIGEAEARNVKVKFYNYDRDGNKQEINPLANSLPSKINSGQTVKTLLVLFVDMAPPFEIVVTWDDDFQNENKLETTLN
jgi:hypothetical protein